MKTSGCRQRLLAGVVFALSGALLMAPAAYAAQDAAKAETTLHYPNATRKDPKAKASEAGSKRLNALIQSFNAKKWDELRAAADAIVANAGAPAYERAFAAQLAAQASIASQDFAAAERYAGVAVDADILNNEQHFPLMLQRAQLQMQMKQYDAALATADRFLSETHAEDVQALAVKGNALYRLGRYADAARVLRGVAAAQPDRADLQLLLADALARSGNGAEATAIAEQAAAKNPGDKTAQFNLVQAYLHAKQDDRAMGVLERMRKAGQLTDDGDYRQLFSIYANVEGKEKQTIEVINEGIAKGVLKPDYNVYLALAQSYYFSDQPDKAIEAYRKAAALGKDGEAYLALAGVLRNSQRISEAKAAAQQALAKGVKRPEDAKKIIALPSK